MLNWPLILYFTLQSYHDFFFQTNEQECESIYFKLEDILDKICRKYGCKNNYERPPIWLMLIDITGNVLCEIFAKKIKIKWTIIPAVVVPLISFPQFSGYNYFIYIEHTHTDLKKVGFVTYVSVALLSKVWTSVHALRDGFSCWHEMLVKTWKTQPNSGSSLHS